MGKKVSELVEEIKQLEERARQLRAELNLLQMNCVHEFVSNELMKTCSKCLRSESIYY